MKKLIWFLVMLVCLTACGKTETPPSIPEEEVCGAPKYEGPMEEALAESVQVEFACEDGSIVVQVPLDWTCEVDEITEDAYAMGISLRPDAETEGWLRLQYWIGGFGVCGTGLEEKEVTFANGLTGNLGYYDGRKSWSFISFYPDHKDYALNVDGAEWVNDYEAEIFGILGTVQLG